MIKSDPTKSLTYVIGNVHGNLDLLKEMMRKITLSGTFASNDTVVLLGNLVDRGPDSKGVIDIVRKAEAEMSGEEGRPNLIVLRGPQDHLFMRFKKSYLTTKGAIATIQSYRKKFASTVHVDNGALDVKQMQEDRRFFDYHHTFYWTKKFFFCSSGVNPDRTIDDQVAGALMFNHRKQDFLQSDKDFGSIVVHCIPETVPTGELGVIIKTKKDSTELNRVNLFTNITESGTLACVVLNEQAQGTAMIEQIIYVNRDEMLKEKTAV